MYQCHRALLGERLWSKICRLAPGKEVPAKKVLLEQGRRGVQVLVLTAGSAAIVREDDRGRRTLLAVRGLGELLGEQSVLGGGERSANVIAVEPSVLHTVPAHAFHAFVEENDLLPLFLRHAFSRVRQGDEIQQELAAAEVPVRLAAALLRLAAPAAEDVPVPVTVRLSQDELAQLIGVHRNTVVQNLAPWRNAGWVRSAPGGGLVLHDLRALRQILAFS